MNAIEIATKLIKLNEGCKLEVYTCPAGFKTFGYGTNLEALDAETIARLPNSRSIKLTTIDEIIDYITSHSCEALAIGLLLCDIRNCNRALNTQKWFTNDLSEFQQAIIIDLAYNIGVAGVLKFKNMIKAIKQRNFGVACTEMLDSKYHYQMVCYGYAKELADAKIDIANKDEVHLWWCNLDKDYKQLRSASNAVSLQFDKPLSKYKEL